MKKPWARWRWALGGWLARLRLWQPGKLMYIGGSDVLPAPLNREEESQLIQRLAAHQIQDHCIEYRHQPDPDIAQIPYKCVRCDSSDE